MIELDTRKSSSGGSMVKNVSYPDSNGNVWTIIGTMNKNNSEQVKAMMRRLE